MATVVRAVPRQPVWDGAVVPPFIRLKNNVNVVSEERRAHPGAPKQTEVYVERHENYVSNSAATLAAIESAKADAARKEKEERLRDFQRRLKMRVGYASSRISERKVRADRPVIATEETAADLARRDAAELRSRDTLTIRVPTAHEAMSSPSGKEGSEALESEVIRSANFARTALESRRGVIPPRRAFENPPIPTLKEVEEARFGASLNSWGSKLREEYLARPSADDNHNYNGNGYDESDTLAAATFKTSPPPLSQGTKRHVVFVDDDDHAQDVTSAPARVQDGGGDVHVAGADKFVSDRKRRLEEAEKVRNHVEATRKAYMQAERVRARETLRDANHRYQAQQLRAPKEKARGMQERLLADIENGPPKAVTMNPSDAYRIAKEGEVAVRTAAAKRHSELARYVDALRLRLKEKCELAGIAVPPVCACGGSAGNAFDANRLSCASNCMYRNNPRAYAKALTAILDSIGVV